MIGLPKCARATPELKPVEPPRLTLDERIQRAGLTCSEIWHVVHRDGERVEVEVTR
jgi:hypothetical protein